MEEYTSGPQTVFCTPEIIRAFTSMVARLIRRPLYNAGFDVPTQLFYNIFGILKKCGVLG